MTSRADLLLTALFLTSAGAADDGATTLRDGEAEAPTSAVRILARFTFADGVEGWSSERDPEYQPWSACGHDRGAGVHGQAGALRTTGRNHWGSIDAITAIAFPGDGTRLTVAYRATGCGDLVGQALAPTLGRKLHGSPASTVAGRWTVATMAPANWTHWSAAGSGAGQDFSTLMLYAEAKRDDAELLIDEVVLWQGDDVTPPDRVREADARLDRGEGEVVLTWRAPPDDVAVASVQIHRGLVADFVPGPSSLIGISADGGWRDGALANFGTYHYRFVAEDASGNLAVSSAALTIAVRE